MANDKNFKVKNGLQAGRYLHQTAGLSDPYDGVTIRPVFHYDMIADVFTADLQLDDISFAGELYTSATNSPWDTTIVDTPISNYSSASWFPVNPGTIAGRVNRDSGGTPSTGTGRTDAVSDTFYLYFETTSPANNANYDFLLRGEEQELSATPTFSFYEARNGTSLGNLNVYVDVVESPWASIPVGLSSLLLQTTGDLDAWVQKTVPMDMFLPGEKIADLSSATYFTHTLTGDTTLRFENPPPSGTAGSFALEVTGADVTVAYDLNIAAYDSKSFSVAGQETTPYSVNLNPDGTKMYVMGQTGDDVNVYNLSTAFDASSASHFGTRSVGTQDNQPWSLHFKTDGTSMYMVGGQHNTVFQYNLTTAFDIGTASYASKSFSVITQAPNARSLTFKPDGTKMYILDNQGDDVYQYTLSTAWDVSTASYDSVSFSVTSQATNPYGITFNGDGTELFLADYSSNSVYRYTLTTAYDISTTSYSSVSFDVSSQTTTPTDVFFADNGNKMYVVGGSTDTIYQYTTGASTPATITYPSSVKWPGGTTPDAPAAGEKDVYTFVTTDGGNTYYGKQAGDAVA